MKTLSSVLSLMIILPIAALTHDYFPIEVGNWWQYECVEVDSLGNSIAGTEYNYSSTIIADTLIGSSTYFIMRDSTNQSGFWEIEEDSYNRVADDTVKMLMPFFDDTTNLLEVNIAILPGPIGMTWTALYLDTMIVTMEETLHVVFDWTGEILDFSSLTVPAGTFENTYHIQYHLGMEIAFPETTLVFEMGNDIWTSQDIGPTKFLTLPSSGPDGPEPGDLQELAEYHVTAVNPGEVVLPPSTFYLSSPYPNPFNPSTTIIFDLPVLSKVTAFVFNTEGCLIRNLIEKQQSPGRHQLSFDASDLPSGIYVLSFQAGDFHAARKLLLLK